MALKHYKDYKTETTINSNASFYGDMNFSKSLCVNGFYKGNINANGLLILGHQAKFEGEIRCDEVIIAGEVKGNVYAKNRVELLDTAKLYGDIETASLKIADGVVFEGKCEMTENK